MSFAKVCRLSGFYAGSLFLAAAGAGQAQDVRDIGVLPYEGKASIAGTLPRIDTTCILRNWRIKGVLACPTPSGGVRVCLWVENPWPTGIFEVVRQPYKTHYGDLKGVFEGLRSVPSLAASSTHKPQAGDGTALQFAEGRVYTYVPDYGLSQSEIPLAIPSGTPFGVSYLSETDAFGWRNPFVDSLTDPGAMVGRYLSCSGLAKSPRLCAGTWGSYSPRVGFINHPSEVMAAYVQALRAGRVASLPVGRIVLQPYPYEPRTGHYIQMIEPSPRLCVPIGFPLTRPIEAAAGSKWGNYLFIHFGVFETCRGCLPVRLTAERPPI